MKKAYLRKSSTDSFIDTDSGEVLDEKTHRYIVENNTDFYMTYCKIVGLMEDMKLGEVKVLAWLASNMQFNNNMVSISLGVKKKIASEMGISVSAVSNSIPKLVQKNILYRDVDSGRGAVYYLHPEYFWKGDLGERKKKLKYVLEVINSK